jgi:hypothetical protein
MDAFIQVISEANSEILEELYMQKKKGVIYSEKLDALFGAPFIAQGEARGEAKWKAEGGRKRYWRFSGLGSSGFPEESKRRFGQYPIRLRWSPGQPKQRLANRSTNSPKR